MNKLSISDYDYLLWDLDGTLTASAPGITNCVKYALESFGIHEEDNEKLKLFVGPPLTESFQKFYGFTEKQAYDAMMKYRERFGTIGIYENDVFDGIKPVLQELNSLGKHLIVATAKPEIYMFPILEHFGLSKYFEFAGGADIENGRDKKAQVIEYVIKQAKLEEAQKAGKILMIGDRRHDVEGAHQNNIPCCGVLWGYGDEEEFNECGADFIITNPEDLLR